MHTAVTEHDADFSDRLRQVVERSGAVLLTGPSEADGDSIGACLALARGIRRISRARVDVAGSPSYRYEWLPDANEMIPDARIRGRYDLAVVLDGDRRRIDGSTRRAFGAAQVKGLIDHHGSTDPSRYDIALLDVHAASTCELIYGVLRDWGCPLDRATASLIYAGLIFDTGGFRHSNTTTSTHELAAELLHTGIDHAEISARILVERRLSGVRLLSEVLRSATLHSDGRLAVATIRLKDRLNSGAVPGDQYGIVDALLHIRGVRVAGLFVEQGPSRVRVSLRSRDDTNVGRVATRLGGGGHRRAAGINIEQPLAGSMRLVVELLRKTLNDG